MFCLWIITLRNNGWDSFNLETKTKYIEQKEEIRCLFFMEYVLHITTKLKHFNFRQQFQMSIMYARTDRQRPNSEWFLFTLWLSSCVFLSFGLGNIYVLKGNSFCIKNAWSNTRNILWLCICNNIFFHSTKP